MKNVLGILILALALVPSLSAANILVFEDYLVGTSAIPGALTLSGQCTSGVCTTTTDESSFLSALSGGSWDLVVFAEQSSSNYDSSVSALASYLATGGKVIAQTWATDDGLYALMEASYASDNGSTITTTGDAVFSGLGSTIGLTNPGWGTYAVGWTPTGSAVGLGTLDSGGYAIILGNSGNTFLNAPLTDTYAPLSDGERLLANEIGILVGTEVPEPGTWALMGLGLAGVAALRRRR